MFQRWTFAAITAATAVLLGTGLAVPAFAGTHPTPTPTVTTQSATPTPVPTCQYKCPPPREVRAQEDFDLNISTLAPDGYVLATGPVVFDVGRDRTVSDVLDQFYLGGDEVNVLHAALGGAAVDRATCSITLDQNDVPWQFRGGLGAYFGARGAGLYDLRGIFSFPTRHFRCTIPRWVTSLNAVQFLNFGNCTPAPSFYDISVQATGWASLPAPRYFAPVQPTV